jgi:hypothetical protein
MLKGDDLAKGDSNNNNNKKTVNNNQTKDSSFTQFARH